VAEEVKARKRNMFPGREVEIGKVPDVMENVFFTGGHERTLFRQTPPTWGCPLRDADRNKTRHVSTANKPR
jgi:hypothetical protein